jgi:replicative DNA helicase
MSPWGMQEKFCKFLFFFGNIDDDDQQQHMILIKKLSRYSSILIDDKCSYRRLCSYTHARKLQQGTCLLVHVISAPVEKLELPRHFLS